MFLLEKVEAARRKRVSEAGTSTLQAESVTLGRQVCPHSLAAIGYIERVLKNAHRFSLARPRI